MPGADGPRCPGVRSARSKRTVREVTADGSKMQPEQPVLHLEKQTVCGHPADSPTRTDSSANLLQLKTPNPIDRNRAMQELMKNTMNSRLLSSSRTVRQAQEQQPEPDLPKVNSSFPLLDLPNQRRDCY
jgi:hypothetical protein